MTGNQRQKLQAVFGALLLITVGPVSGLSAGLGGLGQVGNAGNTGAGNQPVAGGTGNQPTDPGPTVWNESTEPGPNATDDIGPRTDTDRPYAVAGNQPTDPNADGLYEDINGDGAVNIVDADALQRHLSDPAIGANWTAYDFTNDSRTDTGDVLWLINASQSPVINDSDGDGLPNSYELNVSETDPYTADTDGDGVIDGFEDWDNDTLTAFEEYRLGTDPRTNDTDEDGLTDAFEAQQPGVDPTLADTDGDGVSDPEEDLDDDNLSVTNETAEKTIIGIADSDGDGLEDGPEIHDYGTNATRPDTDGDGLDDGAEIRLGTDPLVADTDGDGILDGNETYTTRTENSSLGVDLTLTGEGDVANATTIEPQDDPMFNTSRVENMSHSPVVELTAAQNFSSANVTMAYNDTGVENESRELAVFTYDPELGIFVPLNSTIDTANNTVTAETEHFSTFVVFNVENWASIYSAEEPVRETDDDGLRPVDVTLVMDTSGSMDNDVNLRNTAGQRFVAGLLNIDRAGVVDFDSSAYVAEGLTSDFDTVNSTLDGLGGDGGTDIGDGVRTANNHFASTSNDSRAQVMILLTDGKGSGGISEARTAAEQNTTIYTVGFDNANRDKLREIANITGGEFNYVEDRSELPELFSRIAENTTDINDTDGDGLSDELETGGMTIGGPYGEFVYTDPTSNDTDGDGLSDGQEVGQYREITRTIRDRYEYTASYYEYTANPTRPDTDYDGVDDGMEALQVGSDPKVRDTDGDGFGDLRDRDPTVENTPVTYEARSGKWGHYIRITEVSGGDIEDFDLRAHYSPLMGDSYWASDSGQLLGVPDEMIDEGYGWAIRSYGVRTSDEYLVIIDGHGVADEAPTEYYLNITDDQGHEIDYRFEPEDGGTTADIQRASAVTLFGSASFPSGEEPVVIPAAGAVLVGALFVEGASEIVDGEPYVTSQTVSGSVTFGSETYEYSSVASALEGEVETPVQMSSGESYSDGRSFGWQRVQNTPGLTDPSDVGAVLASAVVAEQYGEYTVTIGENPNGDGHIALWIIGSSVVAASQVSTVGDTIQREREEEEEEEDEETDEDPEPEREEESDDGPGTWERYRLSERQRLWLQRVGDFALRTYSYYNQLRDDDSDDDDDSTELETTSFDMGKGQSTLIEVPGEGRNQTLLVDAGSDTRSGLWEDPYRDDLTAELPTNADGDYVIDHLVVSHNDTDHISYVDEILLDPNITVRNLYFSGVINDIAAETEINNAITSSTTTETLREGDQLVVGEATVDVYNPNETADREDASVDANSIVLHVQHASGEVLTTGDIRAAKESHIAMEFNSGLTSVDILMASHHGTSAPDDAVVADPILDATSPAYLVISNSNTMRRSENDSFAPDCYVFDQADDRNIPVYWTAIHGNIEFSGNSFTQADTEGSVTGALELQSRLPYSC